MKKREHLYRCDRADHNGGGSQQFRKRVLHDLLNRNGLRLALPTMVFGPHIGQVNETPHQLRSSGPQAQSTMPSCWYSPAAKRSFTFLKVSMVYWTSSNVCTAVGIKRSMITSFGTTGYTTMEQKMP